MSKQKIIDDFINQNIGETFTTQQLCALCHCTLPTVLTYIKNNPSKFIKVKRGIYTVTASMQMLVQSVVAQQDTTPNTQSNYFDWD